MNSHLFFCPFLDLHFVVSLVAQLVKNPSAMQKAWVQTLGQEEGIVYPLHYSWTSLVAQTVKNPPAMQETWVQSLGWEDPLEEGMATHSNIRAWRVRMGGGTWWATVHGVANSWT